MWSLCAQSAYRHGLWPPCRLLVAGTPVSSLLLLSGGMPLSADPPTLRSRNRTAVLTHSPCKRAGQSLPTPGGSILGQLPRHRGRMAVHVAPTSVSGLKQLPVPSQAADPCAHQHGGTLLGWGMLRAFPLKREIAFCAQVSKGVALMTVKLRNFTKNKKRDQVGQGSLLEVPSTKDWGICS